MVIPWPNTVEGLAKFATIVGAVAVFLFNWWQSSIRRKTEYNAALLAWANGTLKLLHRIQLRTVIETEQRIQDIMLLEVAIDRGRLFFPNNEIPGASHGWRPRILDWLVYSAELAKMPDLDNKDRCLEELRRGYIEDVQAVLRPTAFSASMMTLKLQLLRGRGPMDSTQTKQPIGKVKAIVKEYKEKTRATPQG